MKKSLLIVLILFTTISSAHTFKPSALFETCFTPGEECVDSIVNLIDSAKKQVLIQAYYLTNKEIIDALIDAKKRGIDVHIILDKSQINNPSINILTKNDIDVKIDFLPKIAHNKTIIVDNKKILTGSFNFTNNAQFKNAENLLIINDTELAKEYVINFFSRFEVSESINKYKRKML